MSMSHSALFLSRRSALARLAGGGVGLALAAPRLAVAAQEATPAAGMEAPIATAFAAAWNSHDADQLLALYTDDGVYEEIPSNTVAQGADEIRAFFEGTNALISDVVVTPVNSFQTEGWAVMEATYSGKYTGEMPGLAPGEGQEFTVPFITLFELEGDKIRRNADYFDFASVIAQIGGPALEGEATPTA
jgi:steroid delta-isomerase-like uncharacterized protein